MIAWSIVAALAAGAAPPAGSVYLETSALADELRPLLVEELGAAALTLLRDEARFFLSVAGNERELLLKLENARHEDVLSRTIASEEGLRPALRIAVLAIEEAIEAELALAAPPVAPVAPLEPIDAAGVQPGEPRPLPEPIAIAEPAVPESPARAFAISLHGGALVLGSGAQPTFRVGAEYELGAIAVGLSGSLSGFVGLDAFSTNGTLGITGKWRLLEVAATASAKPIELGDFAIGAELAIGGAHEWLELTPQFVGTAPTKTEEKLVFTARAGVAADWRFAGAGRLSIAAGAHLRAPGVKASLPPGFPNGDATLDVGQAGAYLTLGGAWSIF